MGHFYTPPNPFVGGAQPLAPHELPPSLEDVPVNNPPFSHGGRLVCLALIVALAQPGDPFPNQARLGSPALLPVAASTTVPLTNEELLAVYAAWQQDQYPQQRRTAFIPGSSVDAPPIVTNEELIAVSAFWPPQDWAAQKGRQLPPALIAVPVDNPPVITSVKFWAAWESWKFPDPRVQSTRTLPPSLLSVVVNNPPVPTPEVFWATYEGWKFPDPRSQSTRNLPPSLTAVRVDNPPIPTPEIFWSAFEWWKDVAPAVIPARPVPQAPAAATGQVAASVMPLAIYAAWQADQPAIQGPRARLIVSVDNPPNASTAKFSAIWENWKSLDPRGQSSKQAQIVSVDNPPAVTNASFWTIWENWKFPDPKSQPSRSLQISSVDNPPSWNQNGFWNSYANWLIQPPPFWPPRYLVQGAVVNAPPPTGRPLWLSAVLTAWTPGDPQPAQRGLLNPSTTAVRVDAPPSIRAGYFGFLFDSWTTPQPQTFWSARFPVQSGAALNAPAPNVALAKKLLYTAFPILSYTALVPSANYTALAIGNNMPLAKDFPPIDAVTQKQTVAFDFGSILPPGIVLTGTPAVTVTVHDGVDATPQSRVTSGPQVGTQPVLQGGSGITNAAVLVQLGTMFGGVTYLLVCSCNASNGDVMSGWNHVRCLTPS